MKRKVTHPEREETFSTGAYSDAIVSNGFLFVSGQASVDFSKSEFVLGTIEQETEKTLNNIRLIAQSAGTDLENIVKCNVYLADIADFDAFNAVYKSFFLSGVMPARTTVQAGLPKGIKVEIDCIIELEVNEKVNR